MIFRCVLWLTAKQNQHQQLKRENNAAGSKRRLDRAAVKRLFPPSQIAQWPQSYLPSCGVAHFLSPDGVLMADVIDCYKDIRADQRHELQRDFAADYNLWCRGALLDFVRLLSDRQKRRFHRFTARARTIHDAEVRDLFGLCPYAPAQSFHEGRKYEFTPFAATQKYAMTPVSCDESLKTGKVHFTTFPQIRNVMHTEFDNMGPSRAISMLSGDDLMPTAEFVQELAFYLRRRVEEIAASEEEFCRSAMLNKNICGAGGDGDEYQSSSFSKETPVVCFFGNGRLAWLLNNSELLPFSVVSVQPPAYAARRSRRHNYLFARDGLLPELMESGVIATSFTTFFSCESISVVDALRKYRPCIALVEPHVDRDWMCDLRGFYSTREVLMLGPVDSPAMGSFAFPFLTFGVTPGPMSYWTYSDSLQPVAAARRIQMPMNPPHVSQGYTRQAVDNISAYMLSPNDCSVFGCQYRCLSYVRNVYPIVKSKSVEPNAELGATAHV